MKPGKRFGLSAEQKIDVWRRWKAGQTLHEIGRAFGKEHSSIRCLVSRHGGIAPALRRRPLLAGWLPVRPSVRLWSAQKQVRLPRVPLPVIPRISRLLADCVVDA